MSRKSRSTLGVSNLQQNCIYAGLMRLLGNLFCRGSLLLPTLLILQSCSSIPADQLKNYALVIPRQTLGTEIDGIDGHSVWSVPRQSKNVLPGMHSFMVTVCSNGSVPCPSVTYRFVAKSGLAYVFRDQMHIDVYDRFHPDGPRLQQMHWIINDQFLDDEDFAAANAQSQQQFQQDAAQKKLAFEAAGQAMEQKKAALAAAPRGTQICRTVPMQLGGNTTISGFIEDHAGGKLEIRVAGLIWRSSQSYDKPLDSVLVGNAQWRNGSLIYDYPALWSFCD